jgi:hypothetical protein
MSMVGMERIIKMHVLKEALNVRRIDKENEPTL